MMRKKIFLLVLIIIFGLFAYLALQTPRLDRDWSLDQVIPAEIIREGDIITIKNVRNYEYRTTKDYTPRHYDTTVRLSDLERVDYIVEPINNFGVAHTFLSFGFGDGQQIAISVEIRKEKGESFSPWRGLLQQFELMYVIADGRDVVDLRANHRQHDVYLYPTIATREQAQTIFVSMTDRATTLMREPEFYNTIFNNCTTNIARHINEITPGRVRADYRLVLPRHSDVLAKELGFIAPDMSIEEARQQYRINDQAEAFAGAPDFSERLREPLPVEVATTTQPTRSESYEVVSIIDGDTIEVRAVSGGLTKRVRYIGIDAPEAYPKEQIECLAAEATTANRDLLAGQVVTLVPDTRDADDYGRLLRYVYVGDKFVNEWLVKEGLAKAVTYPPDVKETARLKAAEVEAKAAKLGIWSSACIPG